MSMSWTRVALPHAPLVANCPPSHHRNTLCHIPGGPSRSNQEFACPHRQARLCHNELQDKGFTTCR
jgi:hypothetical protein